jgi:hypothetical protein
MNEKNDITRPQLVGITGHRDILGEDEPRVREAVKAILTDYQRRSGTGCVALLTLLSAGADLLAAEVAQEMGIVVIALLPFPRDLYRDDFTDKRDLDRFLSMHAACSARYTVPFAPGSSPEIISRSAQARNDQYALAGACMARFAQTMIAVWDGLDSGLRGGTSDIVRLKLGSNERLNRFLSGKRVALPAGPVQWVYTRRRKAPDASPFPPDRIPFECKTSISEMDSLWVTLNPPEITPETADGYRGDEQAFSAEYYENFGERIKLFCAGINDGLKQNA